MAKTPVTLKCTECSYENEPERVYCHNCGTKLDRSLLPKEWEKNRESPERARRRIKRMTNPGGTVKRELSTLFKVLLYAALLAFVVNAVRPPDGLPPAQATELATRNVSADLEQAVASPRPVRLDFSTLDVNSFLRGAVKPGGKGATGIEFTRCFVQLVPGVCRLGAEQSLWGFPVYSGVDYALEVVDGNFKATMVGGSFGRVRVHPAIMQHTDFFFRKIWQSLRREHVHMQRMQSVQVGAGKVTLITKPLAP